jgi:hypothetical protein
MMYLFLAAPKRQDSSQLLRVPSGAQYRRGFSFMRSKIEREPLLDFYQKFLQLKGQALEVSDEQVIA